MRELEKSLEYSFSSERESVISSQFPWSYGSAHSSTGPPSSAMVMFSEPTPKPKGSLYPTMEHLGKGVFRLPGKSVPIYISPLANHCSLDGLRAKK